MQSINSQVSRASQNAQTIISRIATLNKETNKTLAAIMDEEAVSSVWNAFGLYLSRQLRMGRGVHVKGFGIFTFSAPEVVLEGVTNPLSRDKQQRQPVFLIAKEFVKGRNLRSGIASSGRQLRPYQCQTSGNIQLTPINLVEIANYSTHNKDTAKTALERVLKAISDMARNRDLIEIDIPGVGTLLMRNDLAAVAFHESLIHQCRGITKRPISERMMMGDMKLTQNNLLRLSSEEHKKQNNITELNDADEFRPHTAKFPSSSFLRRSNIVPRSDNNTLDRPVTQAGDRNSFLREVSDSQYAMERLKFYIRENSLNYEDAYIDLCNNAFGRTSIRTIKLSQADFTRAIEKMEIPISNTQVIALFEMIDVTRDGFVDKSDWMKVVPIQKSHIGYIKDVVYRNKLHTDDLLQRMNLKREDPPLTITQLRDALLLLDESLNAAKALKLAQDIMGTNQTITINDLVNTFDTIEENDKQYEASWFRDTLHKLRNHLALTNRTTKLREAFEYFDEHQEGTLDTANFKTVIMEFNIGLSVQDINRLVRYIPKSRGLIDYYQFLKMIEDVNKKTDQTNQANDLPDFAHKINRYLQKKRLTVQTFIQQVKKSQSILLPDAMAVFLQTHVFTHITYDQCLTYCKQMDIDFDGNISEDDLQTFLKRYAYFESRSNISDIQNLIRSVVKNYPQDSEDAFQVVEKSMIGSKSIDLLTTGHKKMFESLVNGVKDYQTKPVIPIIPLSEEKFDKILKDLRQRLQQKGMSYEDLFNMLDTDHNGFITITEFSESITPILNLSQPAKDGFFAFIDKKQIGLIDQHTFVTTISKSLVEKMAEIRDDDFNWELEILFKMRNWQKKENLTIEDAFRTVDRDFDGELSRLDLKLFILEVFKYEEKLLTEARINRLFKLMDQYKRGRVTLTDFKRFMEEGFFYGQNKQIFGNPSKVAHSAKVQAETRSSFDWKANARQQIGLIISRHFPSVKQSYDMISGYRKKLIYSKFSKWIEDSNALAGFDLTEKLMFELFSDIDTHRKGFLTEIDWTNAFGHFDWLDQMTREVREACSTFESRQEAFNFFKGENHSSITRDSFGAAIASLFPKRFEENDVTTLWNKIQRANKINFQQFNNALGDKLITYEINRSLPEKGNEINLSLIDRIRRFLRISTLNLNELFQQFDKGSTGKVTNMEFRQVMRQINMGLTSQEIDQLCSICRTDESSMFDWKEFIKMLQLRQADVKIVDRASVHLSKINDHTYNYLITPKDAFKQFDKDHSGFLTFQKFKDFIETLFRLAREEIPPFSIIKDLFEFIDKKRDDKLDLGEWMDAFTMYPNPHVIKKRPNTTFNGRKSVKRGYLTNQNTVPLSIIVAQTPQVKDFEGIDSEGLLNVSTKFKSFLRKSPIKRDLLIYKDDGTWQSTKEFDRVVITIAKNRKYLMEIFRQLSQGGTIPLSEQTIKQEIEKMLMQQGVTVEANQWPCLIGWSMKNGRTDYKFLLSVYKDRLAFFDAK